MKNKSCFVLPKKRALMPNRQNVTGLHMKKSLRGRDSPQKLRRSALGSKRLRN